MKGMYNKKGRHRERYNKGKALILNKGKRRKGKDVVICDKGADAPNSG